LEWRNLKLTQARRDEWLIGRIALKEAARVWIERTYGVRLLPADVVVRVAAGGKPYISGDGLKILGDMPEVSMAHVAGEAVAVVAPPSTPVGIDLETAARIQIDDLLAGGFSPGEQALVLETETAAPLRAMFAWCAKEAAAKWAGTGLNGQPGSFIVSALDDEQGFSRVVVPGDTEISVSLAADGECILAVAFA
jgi:phosphopantetheinyl transferase